MYPNFFVVGASKSGSTTLHNYLSEHPDIFMPKVKELHFFSHGEVDQTYYKPVKVIRSLEDYLLQFKEAGDAKFAGDATPNYLYYPESAKRIKTFNPDSKIIMILRDPVERAISHYLMDVNLGFHNQPLSDFLSLNDKNKSFYGEYIGHGLYSEQVQRYWDLFGEEKVLVLNYERLKSDPKGLAKEMYAFLGADDTFVPNVEHVHNSFGVPRFGFYKMKRDSQFLTKVMTIIPKSVKNSIKGVLTDKSVKKPSFEASEKKKLYQLFDEDIKALAKKITWAKNWIQ